MLEKIFQFYTWLWPHQGVLSSGGVPGVGEKPLSASEISKSLPGRLMRAGLGLLTEWCLIHTKCVWRNFQSKRPNDGTEIIHNMTPKCNFLFLIGQFWLACSRGLHPMSREAPHLLTSWRLVHTEMRYVLSTVTTLKCFVVDTVSKSAVRFCHKDN